MCLQQNVQALMVDFLENKQDVDWSEVRNYKSNFMLENYAEEDMQRLEKFYEEL